MQKIALVTGANSGLGKEIAIGLARAGMKVMLVCRHPERGKKAMEDIKTISGSTAVELLLADLSSQMSVRLLSETIHAQCTRLDVLVNNAGIILTHKQYSADHIELTLATNYLGPFLLTSLLIDLLKKGAPSRIINISSAIHSRADLDLGDLQYARRKYRFFKVYAQSKLLMNLFTFALARKLTGLNITVNCVHPGAVKTHLGTDNARNIAIRLLDKLIKFFFTSPENAAKPIINLAILPEFNHVTGKYFANGKIIPASSESYDNVIAEKVWEITEKMVVDKVGDKGFS